MVHVCVIGDHSALVIDMSRLTFLDCSGNGALVAVRLAIQQRGGSVVVRSPTGQPAHLLTLLAESGSADPMSPVALRKENCHVNC